MGLDWAATRELIARSRRRGAGRAAAWSPAARAPISCRRARPRWTRSSPPTRSSARWSRRRARRVIVMASRALAAAARGPDDYARVYDRVLRRRRRAGDPALARPRCSTRRSRDTGGTTTSTPPTDSAAGDHPRPCRPDRRDQDLAARRRARDRAARERLPRGRAALHRRRLQLPGADPGDAGSDALLGIFDAIAPAAAAALARLDAGDADGYEALLEPTLPLARHLFSAPTSTTRPGSCSWPGWPATRTTSGWSAGWRARARSPPGRGVRAGRPGRPAGRSRARVGAHAGAAGGRRGGRVSARDRLA